MLTSMEFFLFTDSHMKQTALRKTLAVSVPNQIRYFNPEEIIAITGITNADEDGMQTTLYAYRQNERIVLGRYSTKRNTKEDIMEMFAFGSDWIHAAKQFLAGCSEKENMKIA